MLLDRHPTREPKLAERESAQPTISMIVYQGLGNRPQSVSTNGYAKQVRDFVPRRRAGPCKRTALSRTGARPKVAHPFGAIVLAARVRLLSHLSRVAFGSYPFGSSVITNSPQLLEVPNSRSKGASLLCSVSTAKRVKEMQRRRVLSRRADVVEDFTHILQRYALCEATHKLDLPSVLKLQGGSRPVRYG